MYRSLCFYQSECENVDQGTDLTLALSWYDSRILLLEAGEEEEEEDDDPSSGLFQRF